MRNMTEILVPHMRGSRHRSISPHRRLELGKDFSPYRSSPNIALSGKPPLVRASTSSTIILRRHGRQREESPLLTSRREAKKILKDTSLEIHSGLSPIRFSQSKLDPKSTHKVSQGISKELNQSSPSLPKLPSSPLSTPPASRRRAWTLESNRYLKSVLNLSPGSSPTVHRKKRNSTSPKIHFTSLPSSRQSSSKSSTSQGYPNTKTVTFKVQTQTKTHTGDSCTIKNDKIAESSPIRNEDINEQETSDNKDITNDNKVNNGGDKSNEAQNTATSDENKVPIKKKNLPEGLSTDVYRMCLSWLEGVRAADDDKCLDMVTQPDLQWTD